MREREREREGGREGGREREREREGGREGGREREREREREGGRERESKGRKRETRTDGAGWLTRAYEPLAPLRVEGEVAAQELGWDVSIVALEHEVWEGDERGVLMMGEQHRV
jgi:hypothetical protein